MSFTNQQPVGMRSLERSGLIDTLDRQYGLRTGGKRMGLQRTGAEYVDDDGNAPRRGCALDEIGRVDLHGRSARPGSHATGVEMHEIGATVITDSTASRGDREIT